MDEKREIRNTSFQVRVTGENEEKRTVEGYALLFDTPSDGLSFTEVIKRGALDGVLEKSDVFALLNHDQRRGVLARSKYGKGSLSLSVDDKGLKYRFDAPKTALGDELLENIRRGEIGESSFCFDVEKDTWEKRSDGSWKRTIEKFGNIYDTSPVYNGAYSKTSVYMRGKEAAEEELRHREQEIPESYYQNIEKSLNI
ncbi:HK97 family phage prohead protease [Bacteroides thetaiotaomicron]|jgi:HK97 family phage prohead protease|uniref:HK97 family phage prohead protease n=1 Tax=Bacteroides thetaiotaomicron TaxID=818 RepID=UPI000E4ED4AE|nr:HK97 family phage prohead protease [Bacteroides thetaiotaomicron]RGV68527.1 HK97 family phage prohead protease [Bacteroides thetaiotaomicron]